MKSKISKSSKTLENHGDQLIIYEKYGRIAFHPVHLIHLIHLIKDYCNDQKRAFSLYLQYISDEVRMFRDGLSKLPAAKLFRAA